MMPPQHHRPRQGDVGGRAHAGRDLVEQRLEEIVLVRSTSVISLSA
jgi:hypothetical protein